MRNFGLVEGLIEEWGLFVGFWLIYVIVLFDYTYTYRCRNDRKSIK